MGANPCSFFPSHCQCLSLSLPLSLPPFIPPSLLPPPLLSELMDFPLIHEDSVMTHGRRIWPFISGSKTTIIHPHFPTHTHTYIYITLRHLADALIQSDLQ